MRIIYPALAACALIATPVSAQLVGGGLVVVNITDNTILQDIANDLSVDISQVPVTVQVPVSVAAAVCDALDVNALAKQRQDGPRSCTATSNSEALTKFAQKQMRANAR